MSTFNQRSQSIPYSEFLAAKERKHLPSGITVSECHQSLFPFQAAVTRWALSKGRSCIFAGTGLGKTMMQGEFLRQIGGKTLIVAPLAVAGQTIEESKRIGLSVNRVETEHDVKDGCNIINYDRLQHIEGIPFDAVVLDESSILKSHDGATRQYIQSRFSDTPFRLACTATPSPNDYVELGTHAEFVGAMTRQEMLATFFLHDGGDTSKWRLKRHAVSDFWQWVASWACVFSSPADLGFESKNYILPELRFHDAVVHVDSSIGGGLFGDEKLNATTLFKALRESADDRAKLTASKVAEYPLDPWLIWCNTDAEQDLLSKSIPGSVSVRGSDSAKDKEARLLGFSRGEFRILITKPTIAGFGMNWQHCNRMVFCGVTYSFEQLYQAVRRCWRFGQHRPVDVYMVTCNAQDSVKSALKAKEEAFNDMAREMARYCKQEVKVA